MADIRLDQRTGPVTESCVRTHVVRFVRTATSEFPRVYRTSGAPVLTKDVDCVSGCDPKSRCSSFTKEEVSCTVAFAMTVHVQFLVVYEFLLAIEESTSFLSPVDVEAHRVRRRTHTLTAPPGFFLAFSGLKLSTFLYLLSHASLSALQRL
ncbi:hypothetical protein EDC04DRAFT_2766096, partial [Pisolithus marmoratus]